MDMELEKLIEGLTPKQIELMASIFAGRAALLTKESVADSLKKWKSRDDFTRN